ncbi:hypothetical protein FNZ56_07295 [Pseudoluteimonas lycopersici]|uniref:DUF1440 domain-containing protein n=1 Tax=Pseudoluteimonas lycopersici TaxID=1324796 RepID=A0A516V587_9GAMM|nr:hypothetical protein [Lysobacter lycopersici]QDQ73690.1 hypothetical protein FNZ56_07295 [Lysobacter lycopersici]
MKANATKAIVVGGLLGGAGDLLFAIAWAGINGMAPQKLLQVIASGWFGQAAFEGGWNTAAIGFASHFGIALVVAALFSALVTRVPGLLERPLVAGMALGVATFLVMRLVVLPLSAFPFPVKMFTLGAALDLLSHLFLFGTPIAFARRYFGTRSA